MILVALYLLAAAALAIGTAAVYLALVRRFPVTWVHHHYRLRKPVAWTLFATGVGLAAVGVSASWVSVAAVSAPLLLAGLGVLLSHRLHQEYVFPAVDDPPMAADPAELPLRDDAELAVLEVDGVSKAYPLDFVIHHHVVNDRFGETLVALTYCAMCRTVIPFDVTDIGPLFVGSFKNANMIVADRRTTTFFQQASFDSVIGPLHPHSLRMLPFQMLTWADVRLLDPMPRVALVTERDLREFQLPIPGVWRRIVAGETTPGLPARDRDRRLPARTRVVGIIDPAVRAEVYLKEDLLRERVVRTTDGQAFLVATHGTVNGYRASLGERPLDLAVSDDRTITDRTTASGWDLLGRPRFGPLRAPLVPVALSDEYWFSWRLFHPDTPLRTELPAGHASG